MLETSTQLPSSVFQRLLISIRFIFRCEPPIGRTNKTLFSFLLVCRCKSPQTHRIKDQLCCNTNNNGSVEITFSRTKHQNNNAMNNCIPSKVESIIKIDLYCLLQGKNILYLLQSKRSTKILPLLIIQQLCSVRCWLQPKLFIHKIAI